MSEKIRILVAGCGNMGKSHALAYHKHSGFELLAFASRNDGSRERLPPELRACRHFDDYYQALETLKPDAVSICTWPDTHADFAVAALRAGCHVFVEKPLGRTLAEAEAVTHAAMKAKKKVVVGYILHHHPSWARFVEIGRTLGKPLVMRMNLNQQSAGPMWTTHKNLMKSMSPIVDCGVHYVNIMCMVTGARPVQVQAIGVRLSDEIGPDMYNYGQLQVKFDDGSVGWYEAGWGPMMSSTAYFIKDIIGPNGSVSIGGQDGKSSDIDSHTKTSRLIRHHAALTAQGEFQQPDRIIDMSDEPGHQALCDREQDFFLRAIREDLDLTAHLSEAIDSLRIVLAADQSVRTGQVVYL